jgi:hypothetical protein
MEVEQEDHGENDSRHKLVEERWAGVDGIGMASYHSQSHGIAGVEHTWVAVVLLVGSSFDHEESSARPS